MSALMTVPSILEGKEYGHAWLFLNKADYKEFTGNNMIVQTKIAHPDTNPTIGNGDLHSVIAKKTANLVADLDAYYTQEGYDKGLRDLIIKSVPMNLIYKLDHMKTGVTKVTPLQLLTHLQD